MITTLEFKRQLMHIVFGFFLTALIYFGFGYLVLYIAILALLFSILEKRFKVPLYHKVLVRYERSSERQKMPGKGLVFYSIGAAIVVQFFSPNIAMASIVILALGDSTSRIVGPYGNIKHPFNNKKFLEGILLGGLLAMFGARLFVPWIPAALAAFISMIIEGMDIEFNGYKLDDNLFIPIVAALIIHFWFIL